MMNRNLAVFLAAALASVGLVGCDSDAYSNLIQYSVRTDPLVKVKNDLGDEQIDPDRPGVLPLLSPKDLLDPYNPMYPKRATLFKEDKLRDPMRIHKDDRKAIDSVLVAMFGTPRAPFVSAEPEVLETLKLQGETLARGSALYRVNCLHCHGVTGDGRGPTGRWVNPHPRDYRQGLFKFTSVDQTTTPNRPPRREDLLRVLQHGVEGTAMPSFVILKQQDLEDMVSYVIHLSMRGNVEFETIMRFQYDQKSNSLAAPEEGIEAAMGENLGKVIKAWMDAQTSVIKVTEYPYKGTDDPKYKDSVIRGYKLFIGEGVDKPGPNEVSKEEAKGADCKSCHKDFGRQSLYKWDEWGTLVKPRDLTQGAYRGGRRPVDIYHRIHSGIAGSGMNIFGKTLTKSESIWDLVNFVQVLPYRDMRKSLGINID